VVSRSKAWVCCSSLAGIAGSNAAEVMDVCLLRVLFAATGRSLLQRSPTECGVSECDLETSTMGRPWLSINKKYIFFLIRELGP